MSDMITGSGTILAGEQACLIVHGGAWDIPDAALEEHRDGLRAAVERGREVLLKGAAAAEVAAETVATMEAHGAFDAGCGAMLRRDGSVELDAGIMDGATLDYGAVIGVRRLEQPVQVAYQLLRKSEGQARILTREGAERFARAQGVPLVDNAELISERERKRYEQLREDASHHTSHPFLGDRAMPSDTVGCVVRDAEGRLAAATSTGGTPLAPAGRVGDSPLPGAGFYASSDAAVSTTGWGEAIAAVLLAGRTADAIAAGEGPEQAARSQLERLHAAVANEEGKGATAGLIALSAAGEGVWAYSTPRMARGGWQAGDEIWVDV